MSNIQTNVQKPDVTFTDKENNLYSILSYDFENGLDMKIKELADFMVNNTGRGKSNEEKDEIYAKAQMIWNEYIALLKATKYNLNLDRSQYNFLTDLIVKKLEYDVNTVFIAVELTNLLGTMKDIKFTNDSEVKDFKVDATEITYIYHLIATHKVKGLTKDSYTFADILRRIGEISKVFNYYDTTGKNMAQDVQDWVVLFDESISMEQPQVNSNFDFDEEKTLVNLYNQ
jgi:hypothetical protein